MRKFDSKYETSETIANSPHLRVHVYFLSLFIVLGWFSCLIVYSFSLQRNLIETTEDSELDWYVSVPNSCHALFEFHDKPSLVFQSAERPATLVKDIMYSASIPVHKARVGELVFPFPFLYLSTLTSLKYIRRIHHLKALELCRTTGRENIGCRAHLNDFRKMARNLRVQAQMVNLRKVCGLWFKGRRKEGDHRRKTSVAYIKMCQNFEAYT